MSIACAVAGPDGQLYPMYAGGAEAQQLWQQPDPAYMQQMQAYAQMYNALGVAPDGTLLAGGSPMQSPVIKAFVAAIMSGAGCSIQQPACGISSGP